MFSKKAKPAKLMVVSGALIASSFVTVNPQQADASSNVEILVKNAEKLANALKWEISYDHRKIAYPKDVFGYPNMKLFNETKSAMFKAEKALQTATSSQKQALKARLDQNVKTHYDRAVRYIDAVTAGKRIIAKSNALNEKLLMNIMDDSTENAYHALSREIKDRSPIMYKTYGKSSRDALVNHYQLPAYQAKEAALYPVSIKIELDRLNTALAKKDTDQSIYHTSRLDKFFAEAVSEGYLDKDSSIYYQLADAFKNSKESYKKLVNVIQSDSDDINNPTIFGGTDSAVQRYNNTVVITAGKGQYIKLSNAEVNGNIVVKGDHTGAGTVYLENVKVNKVNNYGGNVIVDDVADHSLYFINSSAANLQVNDTNGANIVISSSRIHTVNISESAGSTGGIMLDAGQRASIESVHIAAKGKKESTGITLKGDFSHSKVLVTGENSKIKVGSNTVIQEMEVRAQATIEALVGAVIRALNISIQEKGQVIHLKGDMASTIVNILKASEKIIVEENTVIKEIKKDPRVSENIIVENNGTIESSTGVTVEINPPINTAPPGGTNGGSGSGGGDEGGSVVVPAVPTVTLVSGNPETVAFGEDVLARSSMSGTLYITPFTVNPTSKSKLDELVTAGKAQKVEVTQANDDTNLPTASLPVGRYKVYSVSKQGVLSLPSTAFDYVPLGVNYVSQTSSDVNPNEVGGVQNTINWGKDNSIGLENYSIQRRESRGESDDGTSVEGNTTIANDLALDTESFIDMNVEAGKTYFYYVVSHSKKDDLNYTVNKLKSPGLKVTAAVDMTAPIDISSSLVAPMLKMGAVTAGDIQGISLEADETIETTTTSDVITLNGLHVTAVKAGKANVTVRVKKNDRVVKEGTIEITVSDHPPVTILPDTSNNNPVYDILLAEEPVNIDWRNNITSVLVDGVALSQADWYMIDGLYIREGILSVGNYTITIIAKGYEDSYVTQTIIPNDGPAIAAAEQAITELEEVNQDTDKIEAAISAKENGLIGKAESAVALVITEDIKVSLESRLETAKSKLTTFLAAIDQAVVAVNEAENDDDMQTVLQNQVIKLQQDIETAYNQFSEQQKKTISVAVYNESMEVNLEITDITKLLNDLFALEILKEGVVDLIQHASNVTEAQEGLNRLFELNADQMKLLQDEINQYFASNEGAAFNLSAILTSYSNLSEERKTNIAEALLSGQGIGYSGLYEGNHALLLVLQKAIDKAQDSSNTAMFSSASYDANVNTLVISSLTNIEEGSTFNLQKITYSDAEAVPAGKHLSEGYILVNSAADVDVPGEYFYAAGTLTILLTDSDAATIESLPGFGSKGVTIDTLNAADGWNIDFSGNNASSVSGVDVIVTSSEIIEEVSSKAIVNLDFSTINGTQARLDSMPVTVGDFTGNAKSFTIIYGEDRIPVTISWKLSPDFPKGQAMGGVVESAIQQYYLDKQGAEGLMNRPLMASGFTDTFYISAFKAGADASFRLEGGWSYFFEQNSAFGTDTDTSKNKTFTINDGVNTVTIKLSTSFTDITKLVASLNSQLRRGNLLVTAEVIDDTHFKLMPSSTDAKIIVDGADKDYFF